MKIGVIGCFYGNADLLPEVLRPWVELRRSGMDIVLAGINAQFKEYADLGYANDDHATRAVLEARRADFDLLVIEETPRMEHEVRQTLLDFLKTQKVDAVWLLDGDELYTRAEIERIVTYVERVPEFDYYHVHFENVLFDRVRSRDIFCPPRIIRADRRGGIGSFLWDNEISFLDGTTIHDAVPGIVPKEAAFVKHMTWRTADARKKIAYCLQHFGYSMFVEDEKTKEIGYNREWFDRFKLPVPITYEDGSVGTPTPFLEVYLSLSMRESYVQLRSIWSLVRTLLVFDRANDARFRLVVVTPPGASVPEHIRSFLLLFAIEVLYAEGTALSLAEDSSADLFFFVDDRHLYQSEALLTAYHSFLYFSRMMDRKEIVLSLVDEPSLYESAAIGMSHVVRGTGRHWRTVPYSKCAPALLSREVLLIHGSYLESVDRRVEWTGHLVAFSPMPSLAMPLSSPASDPYFLDVQALVREHSPMPRSN